MNRDGIPLNEWGINHRPMVVCQVSFVGWLNHGHKDQCLIGSDFQFSNCLILLANENTMDRLRN